MVAGVPVVAGAPATVRVVAFDVAPVIDGRLDDAAWETAVALDGFRQTFPGDNTEPSRPTRLLLGRDSENVYLAFRAYDDPSQIRATLAQRDAIFGDDHVGVFLDTFGDARRAYALYFNPFGIQADAIYTESGGSSFEYDVVMESKGLVDEGGYTVEVRIPFASLRYRKAEDAVWRLHAVRVVHHLDGETHSWMPIDRGSERYLAQAGSIEGFGDLGGTRSIEIIPTFAFVADSARRGIADELETERASNAGVTVRIGLTPEVTLDLAANPDFAEVEADAPLVTVNRRFPVFYPEKRPFFTEGMEIFRTPLSAIYTRRIVDPDLAAKLTGKIGRTSFGALLASDAGPGNFSRAERESPFLRPLVERFLDRNATIGAVRIVRDVGAESSVGLVATSYDFVERHNRLAGLDGAFALGGGMRLNVAAAGSTTRAFFFDEERGAREYTTRNGLAYTWSLGHFDRNTSWSVAGSGRSRDFRAYVGFVSRTDYGANSASFSYGSTPRENGTVVQWSVSGSAATLYDFDGRQRQADATAHASAHLARLTRVSVYVGRFYERLLEEELGLPRSATHSGTFLGDAERSTVGHMAGVSLSSNPAEWISLSGGISTRAGVFDLDFGAGPKFPRVSPAALADPRAKLDPGAATQWSAVASASLRMREGVDAGVVYSYDRLRRHDTGLVVYASHIASASTTWSLTRAVALEAIVDYDSLSESARGQFQFAVTPSPGTSFYAGYVDVLDRNGPARLSRTIYLKASYSFRGGF